MNKKTRVAVETLQNILIAGINCEHITMLSIQCMEDETYVNFALDSVCGADELFVPISELESIICNPYKLARIEYDMSKDEYLEWLETGGAVSCYATTAKGARCNNLVTSRVQLNPTEYKALKASKPHCVKHGGVRRCDAR